MLYENITKILNKAKEKNVNLLVARDMLFVGATEDEAKDLNEASKVLRGRIYTAITTLRKDGKEDKIKELCQYIENDDNIAMEKFLKEI